MGDVNAGSGAESDVSDARVGRYLAHEMARRLDAGIAPEAGDVGGQAAQDQGHERHSCVDGSNRWLRGARGEPHGAN